MALDGITLHGIKRELQQNLTGGWVRKIYQPRPELVTINIWNGEDYRLLISCDDDFRIQLTELEFENPDTPPPFTMLLRKHLSGGKITRITQRGLDRVLQISVSHRTEADDGEEKIKTIDLYVELMGRNSNLFLVRDEQILGVLKEKLGRNRDVGPGGSYELPPKQDKFDPFELTGREFQRFFSTEDPVWRVLLDNIEGIGPTLAREIAVRGGVTPDESDPGEDEIDSLWRETDRFFSQLASGAYNPVVYQENGKPVEFGPARLESYSDNQELEFDSLSKAIDYYYRTKETSYETEDIRDELRRVLEDEIERVQGALKNVREQLKQSRNRERLKRTGDVILANLAELEKGTSEAELDDPYNEGETRKVDLDPSLSPQKNAQKYYERYKKLKRGKEKLDRRKKSLGRELQFLQELADKLEVAEEPEDLTEIEGKLKEKGYIDEESGSEDAEQGGPKEYWVKGYKILVGRNARQNDDLVRNASRDDIWLHIRNYAGAHVVIVTDGRPDQVPQAVIVKAAQLAALNSKARGANKATVSYTQAKYVDKPKGAKPGLVQITNEETITVSPREVIS